jgi:HK97 family phage portal protein
MLLSLFRADAGDRSPWGNFWFEPVTTRTLSGLRVSADSALQLAAVWRAVQLLSGHFAMLPLVLKREGSMKKITGHAVQKLFKKPNAWQNGFEWRQMLMGHLLLRGNAYNEIIDDARGKITALLPLHPDRVSIEQLPTGDYRYRVKDAAGAERILPRGQVWHLRGLSSNGITGMSVIQYARESMGIGLSAQSYGARFFANDARPAGGWLEYPGKFADKAARAVFRESVQEAQSSANRGKMLVLDQGMKYHEVGLNNTDAQFLESRKFEISEIARWFGIPPHKLADLDRSTNNNIEQQALEYINDGLLIWTETWEASVEAELLFDSEGLEVEFDFRKLLRGDSTTRYNNSKNGIFAGWLTRNEAREDDGREPIDGLDEPLRPLNMVEENEEKKLAGQSVTDMSEDPAKDDAGAARLQAMVGASAGRVARRMIKSGTVEPQLIAESMAVPIAVAEAWCASLPQGSTLETLTAALIELGTP